MPDTEPTPHEVPQSFVDLLYAESPREAFDEVVSVAERSGATSDEMARLRQQRTVALRVREQMTRQRQREAEGASYMKVTDGSVSAATLDAWFAAGSRPAETARRLHIHPNTVGQRLDRIGSADKPHGPNAH